MSILRSVEHCYNMNRLVISCLSPSTAVCRSCGGRTRFFIPRVALSTSFQRYAAEKEQETNPDSILKPKEKRKGNFSVDLPEAKKQASS